MRENNMMNKNGLVSIITPSYNTGRYIAETIESVINQTYKNWEMIIVDDCSTDDTEKIVSSYNDSRIRFIKNDTNSGAAVSRNKAIREAKGEWIAFLDSDDLWVPDKLESQIAFMCENRYAFSCGYSTCIDENSNSLHVIDTCPKKITRFMFLLYDWAGCLTVMYHVPTVGLVQIEDIKRRNDYALWLQISRHNVCYSLPKILGHYRVRRVSVSHTSRLNLVKAHYQMFRKCEKKSVVVSAIYTGINVVMSFVRKIIFIRKDINS